MLADRVTALRRANIYERHRYRHIIGMPVLRPGKEAAIAAETSFLIVRTMRDGTMDLFAAGSYLDRIQSIPPAACASRNGSWSATASGSIRWWQFRYSDMIGST